MPFSVRCAPSISVSGRSERRFRWTSRGSITRPPDPLRVPRTPCDAVNWYGSELAAHKQFAIDSDMDVNFCDPGSPWQRGSNENTNGLLRQYFPKGTDLSNHRQADLDLVAMRLNTRPRKTLGVKTPAYMLNLELGTGVALGAAV